MARKGMWVPPDIYQRKVTLRWTKPPIWRRLWVPAGFTLADLHWAVQVAMGWDDSHLHEFRVGEKRFGKPDPSDWFMGPSAVASERTTLLFVVLGKVGAKAIYTYDFGDSWEHAIVVEKVLAREPGVAYPCCVGGKLQGPPEDCGGIPGYYNLLEAIRDPRHPSMKTCGIGSAANSTLPPSPLMRSIADLPRCNAPGPKVRSSEAQRVRTHPRQPSHPSSLLRTSSTPHPAPPVNTALV
jgi:hypothetical protein